MILLKKLKLNNFLSHENTEIDFAEGEKALIDGTSGAGKSSIFDAILWVLYGQARADNRSLVRKGAKKGSVCLEFLRRSDQEDKEDTIIITRSTTQAGKHNLEVSVRGSNNVTSAYPLSGVRELQRWIDTELVGASYLLFVNSAAYVQGNTESFVAQTASKRKELLLEIVKAEDYDKYYENARQKLVELENDRSRALGQMAELEARLGQIHAQTDTPQACIQTIAENTKLLVELEPIIKDLEEQKAKFMAASQTEGVLRGALGNALLDVDGLQSTVKSKQRKVETRAEMEELLATLPRHKEEMTRLVTRLGEFRATMAKNGEQEALRNEVLSRKPVIHDRAAEETRITNNIIKIESEPVCPSGVDCPYSGDHTKQVAELRAQKAVIKDSLITETAAFIAWSEEVGKLPPASDVKALVKEMGEVEFKINEEGLALSRLESIQREVNSLAEISAEIILLQATLKEKEVALEVLQKQMKEAEKSVSPQEMNRIANELLSKGWEKDALKAKVAKATAELGVIEQREKEAKDIEDRGAKVVTELARLEEKVFKVELVKQAFGSKGIETMVCDYLLPKLEDKINQILVKLSDFTVRLDTQKASADGEGVIEGLWITIINEMGQELPYEAYSGGEKVRITFAITEAFASLGRQKIGFRLVDEAVLALDPNSLESFLEVVETLLAEFNQVLLISHIQEVKDLLDKKLEVVKTSGISHVR